ncbi:hypothetical protein QVD17_21609 [Tagetes erecta]|uniref:Uncharacterized protein n=1 Tax=Tagetes erecta TaxID=13708 RepID=A0AAD8KFP4_TARER|nr:hypothetical protein QVD17_21609 [Tagetes erecta]
MYMAYGWPQVIPLESGLCPTSQQITYLKVVDRLLLVVCPSHFELWSSSQRDLIATTTRMVEVLLYLDQDGYEPFMRMLKENKVGLNFTVDLSHKTNKEAYSAPKCLLTEVKRAALEMAWHSYSKENNTKPVHLSSWNAVPCHDRNNFCDALTKALEDKKEISYSCYTYHGIDQLIEALEEFAHFVDAMHNK